MAKHRTDNLRGRGVQLFTLPQNARLKAHTSGADCKYFGCIVFTANAMRTIKSPKMLTAQEAVQVFDARQAEGQ